MVTLTIAGAVSLRLSVFPTLQYETISGMHTTNGCFDRGRLDLFWQFVCERQWVWQRRALQRLPPPWTADPILQSERFTNVYRELDPGTRYVIEHILEIDASRPDKLFNVMLYRLIGRMETHATLGFQFLTDFCSHEMERELKSLRRAGTPPFTAAYMVSAYSSLGSADKVENIASLFGMLHAEFDDLFVRVDRCTAAADVHATLSSAYGFGNFLSYQVLVDLLYPLRVYANKGLLPFSHDDWASPGPGARRGIKMLLRPSDDSQDLDVMCWLRDHQHSEFERLGLDFPYLEDAAGNPTDISLANIQNCLCEFHKYVKIREGTGQGRRKFKAASRGALEQSAIPFDSTYPKRG
jgi:hypothetical protein